MNIPYLALAVLTALILAFSAILKLRHDPKVVRIVHDEVGVPLKYLPYLAACELAAAAGLLAGIAWPLLGIAAATGAIVYFVGAIVGHLRVGDTKGIGPAAMILAMAAAALVSRLL